MFNRSKGPNWEAIKAEYLAGGTSYRKLAAKHKVSESTLTKRAIRESWDDTRQQVGSMVAAEVQQAVAAASVNQATSMIDLHLSRWSEAGDVTMGMLRKVKTSQQLLQVVNALDKVIAGQRKVLGLDEKKQESQADADLDEALRLADEQEG